jgi:hypothetical protein
MKRRRRRPPVVTPPSGFAGFRFPPEVTMLAVRWYLRYGLSYRDVEELLAERGIEVGHVSIYRWFQRFTPLLVEAARQCRHGVGERWHVDETPVLDEVLPGAFHNVEQYAVEAGHGRLKAPLRPHAGTEAGQVCPSRRDRPCLGPECATRPLRTRRRGNAKPTAGRCLRRVRRSNLNDFEQRRQGPARLSFGQRNRAAAITPVLRSVLKPRIDLSRALSRTWSASTRLLAYFSMQ